MREVPRTCNYRNSQEGLKVSGVRIQLLLTFFGITEENALHQSSWVKCTYAHSVSKFIKSTVYFESLFYTSSPSTDSI